MSFGARAGRRRCDAHHDPARRRDRARQPLTPGGDVRPVDEVPRRTAAADRGRRIEPELATALPTRDESGTSWTVTVAADRPYADGTVVTAEDVAATYRAILDPAVGSPLATQFAMLREVVTDGEQVEFRLAEPYAGFDRLLTVGIAPAAVVGEPLETSPLTRSPMGAGPYQLEQWRPGESMVLTANPHHPAKPYVDRIVISFVADQNAILQRAAAGSIDGAQLAPVLARTFERREGWQVWANPSADFRAITFPRNDPAYADPRVRRALNLAVDRQRMVDGILFGHGSPAHTPFSADQGDVFDAGSVFDHDPERAGRLLTEAGWIPAGEGIRHKGGVELGLTVMYFANDVLRRDLAVAFAADLADIGVRVEVEAVTRSAVKQRIPDDGLVFGGGDMPYHPDQHVSALLDGRYATFDPGAPYRNPSDYANAEVDELLREGRTATDADSRTGAYRRLQQVYVTDPAMVTLVTLRHTYVIRDAEAWDGLEPVLEPHEHGVAWGPWWNVERWRPKP
ncbi:ABC transporter substrate-binding protein [Microlunatus sp. Y2014]|uniref:ABC transporter substrate-binding protein n=1 Tax=Microlunatus sp. Y2014 TaxID=3418488 RepID=UPI003DA77CFF